MLLLLTSSSITGVDIGVHVVEKGTTCFNSKWFISKLAFYTWRDEIQGQNKNAIEEEKGVGQGEEIRGWTHWEVLRDVGHCPW
jgi:hypothetical protein